MADILQSFNHENQGSDNCTNARKVCIVLGFVVGYTVDVGHVVRAEGDSVGIGMEDMAFLGEVVDKVNKLVVREAAE